MSYALGARRPSRRDAETLEKSVSQASKEIGQRTQRLTNPCQLDKDRPQFLCSEIPFESVLGENFASSD